MKKYPLASGTWGQEEREAILRVMDRDMFTMGQEVLECEQAFAKQFGANYAVMCNSGSSANLLAVGAMVYSGRWQRGDEIIVPAIAWATTYYPLYQYGLKLRFVDIDRETLNISIPALKEAITPNTKGLVAVNLLGNPNEFNDIERICRDGGITYFEDNCESMGAKYKGKYAGTFGLMGTYSSFFSHHISTMEGGFITTDDELLYDMLKCLRAHGWTRNLNSDSVLFEKGDEFYELFHFILPGYNFRPMEMQGAIGKEQLKRLEGFVTLRRQNALYFKEKFRDLPLTVQQETGESSYFGLAFLLNKPGKRNALAKKLMDSGIECRPVMTGNFTKNPVIQYMEFNISGTLDNADYVHENGIFLGNHSYDLRQHIDYAYDVICGEL